ncbi:MAG: hypothetical protein K1X87_12315, partial [Dehalococcoidia bacterium]|nr:hypothetical protein [Dehalococcoidia bacterium]
RSSVTSPLLLLLALTSPACVLGTDEPVDGTEGEPLGVAAQAVGSCADGSDPYYPCYHDFDFDGKGSGAAYSACSCGVASGTSLTNTDCDDSNSARYQTLSCHADADGDHYGASASSNVCVGATCTSRSGYTDNAGDCDDTTSSVRPYTYETAANGVDDDCDGDVDNAAVFFYSSGLSNTSSSFQIHAKLNGADEVSAAAAAIASGGSLYAKVRYRKLEEGSSADLTYPTVGYATATVSTFMGVSYYVDVTLSGLEASKVYRASLTLYQGSGPVKTRIPNGAGSSSSSNYNTNTYYTMTAYASGNDGPVHTARYNTVLNALYEYYYFHTHNLGSWDTSLRDHFDLAAADTAYCSEFYANAGKPFLLDLNPCKYSSSSRPWCDSGESSTAETSLSGLKTWFTDSRWNGSTPYAEYDGDMTTRKPADWLGVNPNDDNVLGQHTQMFLAWDAAAEEYWFVEGNGSANYGYGTIDHTVNVGSHDHCKDTGTRTYCPAGASSYCNVVDGKACFYVKSTGSINNSNMLD